MHCSPRGGSSSRWISLSYGLDLGLSVCTSLWMMSPPVSSCLFHQPMMFPQSNFMDNRHEFAGADDVVALNEAPQRERAGDVQAARLGHVESC